MSSWTMALLCWTRPTSVASKRMSRLTLAVPKPGRLVLRLRVDAVGDDLAHVDTEQMRR